jgi:autotransporter translocation and assembly factor TamB
MRTFRRIVLAILAGALLLVGSLYVYIFKFDGLERIVNARLAALTEQRYNLEVTIGQMKGDIFSGIVLEDVTVYFVDSGSYYLLLDLPRLSTAYSLSNLWNKEYILDYLYLDSAIVTLVRDSSGRWLAPDFSSRGGAGTGEIPSFSIGNLELNNAKLRLLENTDTMSFNDIVLSAAVESRDKTYAVNLRRFEFTSSNERLSLTAAAGRLTYSEGRLVFSDVAAVTGESCAKLNGNVKFADPPEGRVAFAVDNLDLDDVSALFGAGLSGTLDLNGAVSFVGKKMEGSVDIAGNFMFVAFENLSAGFRFDKRRLLVDTLYGTILGNCTIDGSGGIDFSTPIERYSLSAEIKNFNLKQLVPNAFESNLTGRIELTGESFRRDELLLDIHTDLHESSFDEYPLHEAFYDRLDLFCRFLPDQLL